MSFFIRFARDNEKGERIFSLSELKIMPDEDGDLEAWDEEEMFRIAWTDGNGWVVQEVDGTTQYYDSLNVRGD
jgi:hypothetical protein